MYIHVHILIYVINKYIHTYSRTSLSRYLFVVLQQKKEYVCMCMLNMSAQIDVYIYTYLCFFFKKQNRVCVYVEYVCVDRCVYTSESKLFKLHPVRGIPAQPIGTGNMAHNTSESKLFKLHSVRGISLKASSLSFTLYL